jgi:hypothetical protein
LLEEKFAQFGTKWHKISLFFVQRSGMSLRNRYMAIERHRRKEAHANAEAVEKQEVQAGGHASSPFSDEELRMFLEDIFA